MKHFTLLFCTLAWFSISSLQAQADYSFFPSVFTETYVPLENATNLTEDMPGWFQDSFFFELPEPIMLYGGHQFTHIQIEPWNSFISLLSSDGDYFVGILAIPFDAFFVDPLFDPMNSDGGDVLFKYENNVTTIEYRNVAAYIEPILGPLDNLISRFNLQIEINHLTLHIRYRFGPSTISEGLQNAFDNNITVPSAIVITTENIFPNQITYFTVITGNPNDPTFQDFVGLPDIDPDTFLFLEGFPDDGTVYQFKIQYSIINSTDNPNTFNFKVFPNPAKDVLQISSDGHFPTGHPIILSIYDITGSEKIQTEFSGEVALDVSHLPAGIYFINAFIDGQIVTRKWLKK